MGKSVKSRLPELLNNIEVVTLDAFTQLQLKTGLSEAYLRKLLRSQEVRLDPFVEGVRQDTRENLIRTLSALSDCYATDPSRARSVVLESKRHAKILLAKIPNDVWRNEVLLHLNTWLENPAIYPAWGDVFNKNAADP